MQIMDILDRYISKEYFSYFFLIILILASIFLGVDFLSKMGSYHQPISKILMIYVYKLPSVSQQFVPVGCLMATLLVLSNMSRQNEILALYASGISNFRLASSLITLTAVLSTFSFLAFDTLVPISSKREILLTQGIDPQRENITIVGKNGIWYRSNDKLYCFGKVDLERKVLENAKVYFLGNNFQILKKVHGKRAVFLNNQWVIQEGMVITFGQRGDFPTVEKFDEITGIIPEKPSDFRKIYAVESVLPLKDLRQVITKNQTYGLDTTLQKINYHERLAQVFAPLVFVLIAIPFSTQPLKNRTMAKSIGFCFVIIFSYLVIFRISLSIGKGGHLPPWVAGWGPNIIFFLLSLAIGVKKR